MHDLWRGPARTVPVLYLGARRHVLVPMQGTDIPLTVENYPYVDRPSRKSITFVRTVEVLGPRRARVDATMVLDPEGNVGVDYPGGHQDLTTDLSLEVTDAGGPRGCAAALLPLREGSRR